MSEKEWPKEYLIQDMDRALRTVLKDRKQSRWSGKA
jgi:hypothetical protein